MNLVMVLGMLVCMLIVSNALLMSNATVSVNVRSGGSFWLKSVAIVLLIQCSAVSVKCLLLYVLCCTECCPA